MNEIREHVFEALDNAKDNEYDITTWPVEAIAGDLVANDATLEDTSPHDIVPFIREWLAARAVDVEQ